MTSLPKHTAMDHTTPPKPRGRPRKAQPMTTLQRVRKHRWLQEQKNEAHMRELIEIIKSCNEKEIKSCNEKE